MKLNRSVLGLAVAVAGLSLAAQIPAAFAKQGENNRSEHSPLSTASVAISEAQAITIAQGQLAGTVKNIHLDREHKKATWKVHLVSTDGTQMGFFRIDANTGVVLKSVIKPIGIKHTDQRDKFEKKGWHLGEKNHKPESRR